MPMFDRLPAKAKPIKSSFPRKRESIFLRVLGSRQRGNDGQVFFALCRNRALPLLTTLVLCWAGTAQAAPSLSASAAWIRWLPGDLPLAGYVVLKNDGAKPVKLVAATSPAFKRIEFHHSMEMGGMSHMQAVGSLTILAHGRFRFEPGGYHLMMWRSKDITQGERVPVSLKFADGSILVVTFVVKGAAG